MHIVPRTLALSSSIIFNLSYSLLLLALYTWNSPLPAPALEPCTFFIISRAGLKVFSLGAAGMNAGLAGSLRSLSSCARWRSEAESACLFVVVVADEVVGAVKPEPGVEAAGGADMVVEVDDARP
jgi:hypothetical protein